MTDILAAIDRLNSWVRSDSYREGFWLCNTPTHFIYDCKNAVIERAVRDGRATCEPIHLMVTCRDCGGSGRYENGYGDRFDHCWKCASKGKHTLEFVVTAIEGFQWHTPRDKSWRFRLPDDFWQMRRLAVDWCPNQKGRDMAISEVAECLNVLEDAVKRGELPKPGGHSIRDHGDYCGEYDHGKYSLYVGHRPRMCEFCNVPASLKDPAQEHSWNGTYHCCTRDHIVWSAWACEECSKLFARSSAWSESAKKYVPSGGVGRWEGKSIFNEFRFPDELCAHPEIRKWMERRSLLEVKR